MPPDFIKTERKTEELHPNPINPRTLKEKAFKELQKSLKDDPHFFQARPLIVSMAEGRENTIIAGNQRLEAAKALGWATVPVIEVRGATLEEEKQWMVKDNLHKGEWDFEKLAEGFDLDFLKEMGFDEKGLNKVLANVDNSVDDEFDAEKEVEAITEPIVKRGEIWQLGEHRLMCGDSTDGGDVALLMDGKKADMVFTDPPFPNNSGILEDMIVGIDESFLLARSVCIGDMYWFWDNITEPPFPETVVARHVWHKTNGWQANHWEAINLFDGGTKRRESLVFSEANVGGCNRREEQGNHPTPKPISLCEAFVRKGNTILDLFLGSGSTLIACENTGRVCYGMEIDPKYCDVIVKRWEEKTSKKAVKVSV